MVFKDMLLREKLLRNYSLKVKVMPTLSEIEYEKQKHLDQWYHYYKRENISQIISSLFTDGMIGILLILLIVRQSLQEPLLQYPEIANTFSNLIIIALILLIVSILTDAYQYHKYSIERIKFFREFHTLITAHYKTLGQIKQQGKVSTVDKSFCSKCGAKNENNNLFCPKCGTQF
jgi:rubrerythrin